MKNVLVIVTFLFFFQFIGKSQNLVDAQLIRSYSRSELQANYFLAFQYGIDMYRILYTTSALDGQTDTVSGLYVVPIIDNGQIPLLCLQHSTSFDRNDVPSNERGGFELALFWAGYGYATCAADYLGLGVSEGLHPYLHAETEARTAIDMLLAIREMPLGRGRTLNDQLFVTGYSQGGHAALAAHQYLETEYSDDFEVTASAPMSGPYSISGEMRNLIISDAEYFFPNYVSWVFLSYNLAHNLGYEIDELFRDPYADLVSQFANEEISLGTLRSSLLTALRNNNNGLVQPKVMFQDSITEAIENNPDHQINQALRENDLFDWAPEAPTRLYYCMADEQVVYTNSVITDSVMNAKGALDVMAVDVSSLSDHGTCIFPAFNEAFLFFSSFQKITTSDPIVALEMPPSLYPNPTNKWLHIKTNQQIHMLEVIDPMGKTYIRQYGASPDVDISNLTIGTYFLRLQMRGQIFVLKFIKR